MLKDYLSISEISGPLLFLKDVEGVGFGELARIELPNGDIRRAQVLEKVIRSYSRYLKGQQISHHHQR